MKFNTNKTLSILYYGFAAVLIITLILGFLGFLFQVTDAEEGIDYSKETTQAVALYAYLEHQAIEAEEKLKQAETDAILARLAACRARSLAAQMKLNDTPQTMVDEVTRLTQVITEMGTCFQ